MVLAVHVVGDGAAHGHVLGARRDREEEAAREREVDDLGEQYPGLAAQDAARGIEGNQVIQVARAQQRVAVVQARVAVAAADAVGQERSLVGQRQRGGAIAHAAHALNRREHAPPRAETGHLAHVAMNTTRAPNAAAA